MATISLTFMGIDAYGNLAPGIAVKLSASGQNNAFGAAPGTTDANGQFTTTLPSTLAQTEMVTAAFDSSSSVAAIVRFAPGAASNAQSNLRLSPNTQVANNSNTIFALLILRDANGNYFSSVSPSFSASGLNTTISSVSPKSAAGQSSTTYQTALAQNENDFVIAGGLSFVAPMTFVAGPPSFAASSLTASPSIAAANGSAVISLMTTARDTQDDVVAETSIALSASGGNSTFAAANGNTSVTGIYTTTLKSN